MKRAVAFLILARCLALVALYGLSTVSPAQDQSKERPVTPSIFVEVQADGEHCIVRKMTIPCADVLSHLRQVLNLAPGYWVRFKADRAASYEVVRKIMDEIAHSEYRTSAAFL